MARIILEDMKLNKDRRPAVSKKEIDFSPREVKEEIIRHKEVKPKEEPVEEKIDKKETEREEAKIDEYFKSIKNVQPRLKRTPEIRTKSKIIHKPVLVFFVMALFLGAVYWGGNVLQKANITITSKHQLISYKNKQFTASKDGNTNNVNFEIMITPSNKSVSVILTEPKEVSIKSQGSVTLYNTFSTKSEKISAGTFLSDDTGKTYKTNSTVSVPGYKTENKKIVPGQIAVNITSFLPGDAYNGSPTDFHVNSFKGSTKYNKVYGKLKSPLVGGASGVMYTLDEKSKSNIDNIAKLSFKQDLLDQVKSLVPAGYIIYPGAITFSYNTVGDILSKTPETNVDLAGVLSVVLIKEKSLEDNIIKNSLPNVKGEELKEVSISGLNNLSFSFTNAGQLITKDLNSVSFLLSGDVDAVWNPNAEILKTKLIGVRKDNVLSVFRQDPGIASALVKIFPPWQKYIPSNPLKININIQ